MEAQSKEIFTYHETVARIINSINVLAESNIKEDMGRRVNLEMLIRFGTMYAIGINSDAVENKEDDKLIEEGKYFHYDKNNPKGVNINELEIAFYKMVKKQALAGLSPSQKFDYTPQRTYAGISAALEAKG